MLAGWLSKLERVHFARTPEEREAVYRFRYEVYCDEFGRELGGPDHERRRLHDDEDDKPGTDILYTGSPDEITGTMRLRHWAPGEIPEYDRREMSMAMFPRLGEWTVGEVGRLMVRRARRGKLILASLARTSYDYLTAERNVDLTFCYCSPGLVHHYRKLGYRPFGGAMVNAPDGVMVPLVNVHSDHEFYRRNGSLLASQVKRHFGRAGRTPMDRTVYRELLEDGNSSLQIDSEAVWNELQDALASPTAAGESFLRSLPEPARRRLTEKGFVLQVDADTLITREGFGEQEMYLVLDGQFEVTDGEQQRLTLLGAGDLFGEVAFFTSTQRRTASVRALGDGRLLVLRASALRKLMDKEPAVAAHLLFGIGRVMAQRIAQRRE